MTDDEKTQARKKNVAYVMSLSEEDMIALVPRQSGLAFTDCPDCDYGMQEWDIFDWSPEQPERITCRGCGAVYPNNPQYPDNEYISVKAPEGEHRYYYYERPDGYRIFFRAHADYLAAEYMARWCQELAELYQMTGEESYARRSALVLIRFAQVYPGWAHKFDWPFVPKVFSPYDEDRIEGVPEYHTTKWSYWAVMGISQEMLRAYDILRFWPGFAGMAGGEARELVENDLLASMVNFVMGFEDNYGDMSPGMWCDFIHAGRLLDRPAWVLEALRRADFCMSAQFTYDGYWLDASPTNCGGVLYDMEGVLEELEAYKPSQDHDSAILSQIAQGRERMAGAVARLKRGYLSTILATGMPMPLNDSGPHQVSELERDSQLARSPLPFNDSEPRRSRGEAPTRTDSLLLPGMGLAMLGGGEGERQICAWLNFTAGKLGMPHKHMDALDIGLVAYGRELLRDIGYMHTAWRAWSVSAMSHNTVVVNGRTSETDSERVKTRLRVFASDKRSFHLVEAESEAAYPGVATRYRRSNVLVGADSEDAYLIDIFQVTGGHQHDYLLHGSAAEDSEARVSGATLKPLDGTLLNPGTAFAYPRSESSGHGDPAAYYGYVRDLRSGAAGREIIWELRLGGEPTIGLRSHILCEPGDTVYLGEAPRMRPAEGNDELLSKFYAPFFCLRRQGKDLKSVFVAVHEPVRGAPKVEAVSATMLEGGVLVTIDRGRLGRDYFVAALDEQLELSTSTADGPLQFRGRCGLMRLRDGRMREGHLVDGDLLSVGDSRISGTGSWEGVIRAMSRTEGLESGGFFEVNEQIPEQASTGALVIRFPYQTVRGFNLVRIQGLANGTRLYVLEDPGYTPTDDNIELLYYPRWPNSPPLVGRTISGSQVRYWLPGMTQARVPDAEGICACKPTVWGRP